MTKFYILLLLLFMISCEQATELEFQEEDLGSSSDGASIINSPTTLYAQNCASCHNALDNSTKLDRTAAQIQNAIQSVASMQFLTSLSSEQINLIEEALSYRAPVISNPAPFGEQSSSTTSVDLTVTTDEPASCRYSSSQVSFSSMVSAMNATNGNRTHTQVVSVVEGNSYTFYVQCSDNYNNVTTTAATISFSVASSTTPDTTPPAISQMNPINGSSLASNTTSVTLSFATNENASCRYSTVEGFNYGAGILMNNSGAQAHSQDVVAAAGQSYTYHFKCRDEAGNYTSNFSTGFSIANINLNGQTLYANHCASCHGDLVGSSKLGRTAIQIESAIGSVASMNSLSFLNEDQLNALEEALSLEPPIMFNLGPSGELDSTVTSVTIKVDTTEKSICKYSSSNTAYASMTNSFNASSDGKNHTKSISVSDGNSYTYYVQCADQYGNATSTAEVINFNVRDAQAPDTQAPLVSSLSPAHNSELAPGTSTVVMTFLTNEDSTCKYYPSANRPFNDMINMNGGSGATTHEHTVGGQSDGTTRSYFFKCSDSSGNITSDIPLTWTIREVGTDGGQLYAQNCLSCHGTLADSTKKGRSFEQIKNAITQNSTMASQAYLQGLTDSEIQLIADALVISDPGTGAQADTTQKYVLGTRRYIYSKFKTIFVNDGPNSNDNQILTIITNLIKNNEFSDFGGACTGHSTDCPGASEAIQSTGLMSPNATTVRRSYFIRACRSVLDIDRSVSNVLGRAGLSTSSSGDNDTNINKVFDVFSPGMSLSSTARSDLKGIYSDGKSSGMSNTDAWRMVLYTLCESSMFELY